MDPLFVSMLYAIQYETCHTFFTAMYGVMKDSLLMPVLLHLMQNCMKYSRLSLSQSQRDPLQHFEISVL